MMHPHTALRYINHSCDPTSLGIGEDVEIAVRDIHPGEQLSSEYGTLNVTADLHCQCGASTCRGLIRKDDLLHHWQEWDALVSEALALVTHMPQPLWPFLTAPASLVAILQQKEPMPSHLHAYSPQQPAMLRMTHKQDHTSPMLSAAGCTVLAGP